MTIMQELPFEYLLLALEANRGVAEITPTVRLNLNGMIEPKWGKWRPDESTGTKAAYHRSKVTKTWSEFSADGPLEVNSLLVLLQSLLGSVPTPTTPANGVLTKLWTFLPDMTSDTRRGLTMWGGDPNIQVLRSAFGMVEEVTISSDTSGEDGAICSISGKANFPVKVADPVAPAYDNAPLFASMHLSAWLDSSLGIGTTAVTGRVVSAEHTLSFPIVPKHLTTGPGGGLGYTEIGSPKSFITTRVTMVVPDFAQYDRFANQELVKLRVRHNGPLIESVTPDYYYYCEVDTYGLFELVDQGDMEGANRTFTFEVVSEYDDALAADCRVAIQGIETALP